jgi:hypothetical protein
MPNLADTLQRTLDNYGRIWLMCTELIVNPTQANIDTLLSTAESLGVVTPKPTVSLGQRQYQWTEYQQALGQIMKDVRQQLIYAQGLFETRSQAF